MPWEDKPQASVSTAFSRSPNLSRMFLLIKQLNCELEISIVESTITHRNLELII